MTEVTRKGVRYILQFGPGDPEFAPEKVFVGTLVTVQFKVTLYAEKKDPQNMVVPVRADDVVRQEYEIIGLSSSDTVTDVTSDDFTGDEIKRESGKPLLLIKTGPLTGTSFTVTVKLKFATTGTKVITLRGNEVKFQDGTTMPNLQYQNGVNRGYVPGVAK
jgi:hypothetical protein